MKTLRLTRIAANSKHGTFGVLTIDGSPLCVTLEPYWRSNKRDISCIPTGSYDCEHFSSSKHPNTYIVKNVEGRSNILFHVGNTINDTSGCLLLGSVFSSNSIKSSRVAFNRFITMVGDVKGFKLIITEVF